MKMATQHSSHCLMSGKLSCMRERGSLNTLLEAAETSLVSYAPSCCDPLE